MTANDGLVRHPNRKRRTVPAEMTARPIDACAPARKQAFIELDAAHLEHRTGAGEEQVAAGQASRVVEGQTELDVQSSASGAKRTPRSSRIRPSSFIALS